MLPSEIAPKTDLGTTRAFNALSLKKTKKI